MFERLMSRLSMDVLVHVITWPLLILAAVLGCAALAVLRRQAGYRRTLGRTLEWFVGGALGGALGAAAVVAALGALVAKDLPEFPAEGHWTWVARGLLTGAIVGLIWHRLGASEDEPGGDQATRQQKS